MPPSKIIGLVALSDLLIGLALALVGVSTDNLVLQIVGAALLLTGGLALAFVVWSRNRPQAL